MARFEFAPRDDRSSKHEPNRVGTDRARSLATLGTSRASPVQVFDCDRLDVPWIGRAQFEIEVDPDLDDVATCGDVGACEWLLVHDRPDKRVLEVNVDKVVYGIGLDAFKSEYRTAIVRRAKRAGLPWHTVEFHRKIVAAAKHVVRALGGRGYNAAHLRSGRQGRKQPVEWPCPAKLQNSPSPSNRSRFG